MIFEWGNLRILADTIAAISMKGEQSTIYTTGGAIPCSAFDAEYFAQRWEQWNEEIEDEEEIEEEDQDDDE